MARMPLSPAEQQLVFTLNTFRDRMGWTVRELAADLGVPQETLRGVLYAKNRPGLRVLNRLLAYTDGTHTQVDAELLRIRNTIRLSAIGLWRAHLPGLLDRLWHRIRGDFKTTHSLLTFLQINSDEWTHFTRGHDPSPTLLEATISAYTEEAQRISQRDPEDARWCEETAEFARLIMRVLSSLG